MTEQEIIESLTARTYKTDSIYKLWWALFGEDSEIEGSAFKVIPKAIDTLRRSLFDALIVNCDSLFDNSSGTASFPNLKKVNPSINIPDDLKALSRKITILRNNCIAHHNAQRSHAEHFSNARLTPGNIEEFIKLVFGFLESIQKAANKTVVHLQSDIGEQALMLHNHLTKIDFQIDTAQ